MAVPHLDTILVISACVLVGYTLKGTSGFAEAIPLASLGHLVLPIPELIAVIAVLDVIGSLGSIRIAKVGGATRYELAICVPLLAGIIGGVVTLRLVEGMTLSIIFAGALAVAAIWIILNTRLQRRSTGGLGPVDGAGWGDYLGAGTAGFTGGVSGIDGPPLVGMLLAKHPDSDNRPSLMRLLLASSVFRLFALLVAAQVTASATLLALFMLPLALVAFYVGHRISSGWTPVVLRRLAVGLTAVGIVTVLI